LFQERRRKNWRKKERDEVKNTGKKERRKIRMEEKKKE
jgi:hypothetical protein